MTIKTEYRKACEVTIKRSANHFADLLVDLLNDTKVDADKRLDVISDLINELNEIGIQADRIALLIDDQRPMIEFLCPLCGSETESEGRICDLCVKEMNE